MNRERWLLLVSILIFVGLAVHYSRPAWKAFFTGKKAPSMASQRLMPTSQPALQAISVAGHADASAGGELIDETTPWERNPFLTEEEAAGPKARPSERLQVKTIIVGWPKPVATIDGRTVIVGEKIGEETVVEIRSDSVVLERDGNKRVLEVSGPSVSIEVNEVKR